jgi:hypothetical protein
MEWPWYLYVAWAALSAFFIGGWAYYIIFESDQYERPIRDFMERRRERKRGPGNPP